MSTAQKIPFSRTLPLFAQQKAVDEIKKLGFALPGHVVEVSGGIVTVSFDLSDRVLEPVQMPVFGPEYIRWPIQAGDKGVAFPASVYIGGVSGLGDGTADTTQQTNLSTLVWFPVANTRWTPPTDSDPTTLVLYGVTALLLRNSLNGLGSLKLTGTGITLAFGAVSLTIDATGISLTSHGHTIVINATGVVIDGKIFLLHDHAPGTYVANTAVTGISGPVV